MIPALALPALLSALPALPVAPPQATEEPPVAGQALDPRTHGPGRVRTWAQAAAGGPPPGSTPGPRRGEWVVPPERAARAPRSGRRHLTNEWGDARLAIGFPAAVDLDAVWVAGHAGPGVWPPALRALGWRGEALVATTEWFTGLGPQPRRLALGLEDVDRVELEALPAFEGAAWYALDDLEFRWRGGGGAAVVLDFEDLPYGARLTGSGYAGLVWERGSGFARPVEAQPDAVPAPRPEPSAAVAPPAAAGAPAPSTPPTPPAGFLGGGGTAPVLVFDFAGLRRAQALNAFPPDTQGAAGPDHVCQIVNRAFAVFDRLNGALLGSLPLGTFLPGAAGDPRILYDPHSARWIAVAIDFGGRVQLGVSLSGDPLGSWFTTDFLAAQGSDAGCSVDFPTLGIDADGVYVAVQMTGCGMTIFAIDKAPLLAPAPGLGAVTAFRGLALEGALQPALTYGAAFGEFVVSASSGARLRVRRVNPPITAPTLSTVGLVTVPAFQTPPDVPALGSVTPLDTTTARLMNAVYRDGALWTTHHVRVDDRAAVRWYELDPAVPAIVQQGQVDDPELHFFYPSVAVNADGDAALGFTGASPTQYAGAWFTGRLAGDPAGEMAPPALYRAGVAAYNVLDPQGRNRWGDYSATVLDPLDERTFFTFQEHTLAPDEWGTWVGQLEFGGAPLCPDPQPYCVAAPNSTGVGARMLTGGSTSASLQDLVLVAVDCPANQVGTFYYGPNAIQLPFGDGFRCVGGGTYRFPSTTTNFFGEASFAVDFGLPPAGSGPGQLVAGATWNFQFWYRDPAAGGSGFNLSEGLRIQVCP